MRPQLLLVPKAPTHSFSVRHDTLPFFFNKWHYHADVELLHIVNGYGTQFIGDNISRFTSGDVLLVGSNLPHYWRCDDVFFQNNTGLVAEAKVTHFLENFWGHQFLELPENKHIASLLKKSRYGIKVVGEAKAKVQVILNKMLCAVNGERIVLLLEALNEIASSEEIVLLSSQTFQADYNEYESERIHEIYNYTMNNFKKKISLEEIAKIAYVSPNSFCRYFKSHTGKTYSRFLIEVRVGHACKLLIEDKYSASKICYESGFNNFSNFNRHFRMITGKSPLEYKKAFCSKEL